MMKIDATVKKAISEGRKRARAAIKERNEVNRRLSSSRRTAKGVAEELRLTPARSRALGSFTPTEVLIAEGDSWFDYPWKDILDVLEDDYGYEVTDAAQHGDKIEDMAYRPKQFKDFIRKLDKSLRRGEVPGAILLSGGGNDIAGDDFSPLLNHASSPSPGLNDAIADEIIHSRVRSAYITMLCAMTDICVSRIGKALPIIMHGYDYPIPDGRGFWGGWGPLPGPWFEPGFRAKGYGDDDMVRRKAILKDLIDRFNNMQKDLITLPQFSHVRHVDLRNVLKKRGTSYKDWWANELHPTRKGFEMVTSRIAKAIPAGLKPIK